MGSLLRLVLLSMLLLACDCRAIAHENGGISIVAEIAPAGQFRICVVIDSEHVPMEQRSAFGSLGPRGQGAGETEAERARRDLTDRISPQCAVMFDGRRVPLEVMVGPTGMTPGSGSGGKLEFALVGRVPPGSREFSWSCAAPVGRSLLRIRTGDDEQTENQWLEPGQTSRPFAIGSAARAATPGQIAINYVALGFTHILPKGLDHILFVLSLFLLTLRVRPMLAQVTMFTLAHSITLALATLGAVSVPSRVVEPLIAISIALVALENLWVSRVKPSRRALVFAFGLLHGLGFASALRDCGLPEGQVGAALLWFNVGVETGQLTVLGVAYLVVGAWAGLRPWARARITWPASGAIAVVSLYWAVARVVG